MKHFILTLSLAMMSIISTNAQAPSAKVNKVWIEHNLTIGNRPAMRVHCNFIVNNMVNKPGYIAIWVQGPDKEWHNIKSEERTSRGTAFFKKPFTPKQKSHHYSDFYYTINLDDLNLLSGRNKYNIVVTIHDPKGSNLAQSDYIEFTGTGASKSNDRVAPKNHNHNHNHNHNSGIKTWREELGYGGFVIVNEYPNGSQQRIRYRLCPNCSGSTQCKMCFGQTTQCPFCEGKGYIVSAGYGTIIPCYNCQTTGACAICGGTGKCKACENSGYPGYVIAATTYLDASGNVTSKDKAEYNGYNNNDNDGRRDNNNNKQICPDCGGTRLYHGGTSPEYAEPNRELIGLYHSAGSRCSHCGHYDEHWHSKCPTCKHYPGTKNPYR